MFNSRSAKCSTRSLALLWLSKKRSSPTHRRLTSDEVDKYTKDHQGWYERRLLCVIKQIGVWIYCRFDIFINKIEHRWICFCLIQLFSIRKRLEPLPVTTIFGNVDEALLWWRHWWQFSGVLLFQRYLNVFILDGLQVSCSWGWLKLQHLSLWLWVDLNSSQTHWARAVLVSHTFFTSEILEHARDNALQVVYYQNLMDNAVFK